MEVGSPEWIEASLAKLDNLEQQRGEHEAALETATDAASLEQHGQALSRLDAEIKALYAQLESFAEDEDDEDDEAEEQEEVAAAAAIPPTPSVTLSDNEIDESSSYGLDSAPPAASPFGGSGGGGGGFGGGGGGFDAPAPVAFDDDIKPAGGGAKWAFIGLVVAAGLGVGGFFLMKNMEAAKAKEDAKPQVAEEIKIEAAAVPDDTEAPNAAKGGDATISPTANGNPSSSGGSGGSGGGSKKADPKKKKPLELKGGGDPLGGDPLG